MRAADAHGKHLFLGFAPTDDARPGHWLHVHLGLYGGWELQRHGPHDDPAPPRGAVRVRLLGDTVTADLRGPTACDVLNPAEKRAVHARLGADPLRPRSDPEQAWRALSRSRAPVGGLLMQQEVVAGVGNVYRAEVLFRAGLSPFRPGREVDRAGWEALWLDLRSLLRAGVRSGRIVTTERPDRHRRTGPATREDAHYVYRRTGLPCRRCGTPVRTEVMATRNLFWCPVCQAT